MKTTILFILSAAFYLSLSGCSHNAETPAQLLDVTALEQKMNSTNDKIVLDVRTSVDYRQGHLAGATFIDVQKSDFEDKAQKLEKSKPLFVYCASDIRSEEAVEILDRPAYGKTYELEGGSQEWEVPGNHL